MGDPLAELAQRLEALSKTVEEHSTMLAGLRQGGASRPERGLAPSAPGGASTAAGVSSVVNERQPAMATLVGRSLIVLGGAFLLRAFAQMSRASGEAGMGTLGVYLGMAYAGVWVYLASRAGLGDRRRDACCHGFIAAVIAFPLLWESSARLQVLPAPAAAGAVLGFGALLLAVAWARELSPLAWAASTASLATAASLLIATGAVWVTLPVLLLLGAGALGIAEARGWTSLRWAAALIVDLAGLVALMLARHQRPSFDAPTVTTILLSTSVLFLGAVAYGVLARRRAIGSFEVLQSLAAIALGYGGSRLLLHGSAALAGGALALGGLSLAAALLVLDRQEARQRDAALFTVVGALLMVEGLRDLLPMPWAGVAWCALAFGAARYAVEERRVALRILLGPVALVGTVAAGLEGPSLQAVLNPEGPAAALPTTAFIAWALTAGAYVFLRLVAAPGSSSARPSAGSFEVSGFLLLAIAVWGALGAAVIGVAPRLLPSGAEADLGAAAALRTLAIAAASVTLAWIGRRRRACAELRWASYLLLGLGGVKVLFDDLPHGRALTLFLSLAIYGGALILSPKLLRSSSGADAAGLGKRAPAGQPGEPRG